MEFLSHEEVLTEADGIEACLYRLLGSRRVVPRPRARQWQFLRACWCRVVRPDETSDFDAVPATRGAQYKFEVEDRLRRYYLQKGASPAYLFALLHQRNLALHGVDETYPTLAGYALVVCRLDKEYAVDPVDAIATRRLLERVVIEANRAEFELYQALPEVRLDLLRPWFVEDGPAWRDAATVAVRHHERGWNLRNPYNPSSHRMIDVKVKRLGGLDAVVATTEHWYLRWWDQAEGTYAYIYRETNRQTCLLKKDGGTWKVYETLRPPPRTSAPNRRFGRRPKLQL